MPAVQCAVCHPSMGANNEPGRLTAVLQSPITSKLADSSCCCHRRRQKKRPASAAHRRAATWLPATAVVALLLLIVRSLPGTEAAGFWGLGSGRAGRGFPVGSDGPDDGDMAEVFAKFQEEQVHTLHRPCSQRGSSRAH